MGKQIEAERESCPACGALPCDWCEDPHKAMSTPEISPLIDEITARAHKPDDAHAIGFNAGLDAAVAIVTARLAGTCKESLQVGELVERVARAMSPIIFKRPDSAVGPATLRERERMREYARAAISALDRTREPHVTPSFKRLRTNTHDHR